VLAARTADLAPLLGGWLTVPAEPERAFCCIARAIFARGRDLRLGDQRCLRSLAACLCRVRQPGRAHRVQLGDLGEHGLQAYVAGNRLDQRQRLRLPVVGLVIAGGRGQLREPRAGVRAEPRCHPQRERLVGLVQGRADDPVAAARGRRLDPLGAAPGQQFPADPVSAALGLADAGGQPFGELAAVLGAALPEPEVAAGLRPVVVERVPGSLIETKVGGGDAGLPGDELHRVAGQLRPPAREPAGAWVELQQQREPQPGRPALPGGQLPLIVEQRPVLDQLVQVHPHHRAFVIRGRR
jgi:hypothetical protein